MVKEATIAKAEIPYIHRYYNVKRFYADSGETSMNSLLRMQNSMVKATDENEHLPRFIIFFPDKDLIESLGRKNLDHGAGQAFGKLIDKLLSMVDRIGETLKADMYYRRPGSISPGEPKFIWVKMLQRYGFAKHPVYALTSKFNAILESSLVGKKHTYIVSLDEAITASSFDRNADLRPTGLIQLWNELDDQIHKFDRQQISLKPQLISSTTEVTSDKEFRNDKSQAKWQEQPERRRQSDSYDRNGSGDFARNYSKPRDNYR